MAAEPVATAVLDARAGRDQAAGNQPAIMLTYGHSGDRQLRALLEDQPKLACTVGTGVLPACVQAAAAWRHVDGRPDRPLSPLAVASIRMLAVQLITARMARVGGSRWCETAMADPGAAETFLQLFPGARFVCLHRACPDVVAAVLRGSPWGISGPAYAPYLSTYPFSTAAALTAWWAGLTSGLTGFERDHPDACLRVRFEDLLSDRGRVLRDIRSFLGLHVAVAGLQAPQLLDQDDQLLVPAADPGPASRFPVGQVPAHLVNEVNDLHAKLGYPPLRETGG